MWRAATVCVLCLLLAATTALAARVTVASSARAHRAHRLQCGRERRVRPRRNPKHHTTRSHRRRHNAATTSRSQSVCGTSRKLGQLGTDPVLFGDQNAESSIGSTPAGSAVAFPFTNQLAGTATSVTVYVDANNQASGLVAGLYSDKHGRPGSLLATGSLSLPTAGAWNTVSVGSASVYAGRNYWIALLGRGGSLYFLDRSNGPCTSVHSKSSGLTSLPSSWSNGPLSSSCPVSAFVSGYETAPWDTAAPTISGQDIQGQRLTASTGTWSNSPSSYAYQWRDCTSSGCSNISGATSSTYTLQSSDVGDTADVAVTAANAGGSGTATSSQTAVITADPSSAPVNMALPTISGTPQQGQTLTATTGTWSNSPTAYAYQWQDCTANGCSNVAGATSSSYVPQSSDVGDALDVVVTASNAGGSSSASSAPTAVVVDTTAPTAPTGLMATSVSASSVSLAWVASSDNVGVAGYNVFVNGVLNGATSSTAYTVSLLACGTTYSLAVQAFDQAGNLSPLATLSVTTASCAPPPVPNVCTKTLASGGDVSSFVNSLQPGDVGCLHGGTYTNGTMVTWTASGTSTAPVTVTSYPGEQAEIVGSTFNLDGNHQVFSNMTVHDVCSTCYDIAVDGTGNRIEHDTVYNTGPSHDGILLHTDAYNAVITRNYIHDVGTDGTNQYHGIYVQGSGHIITNNVFANIRGGYGIHVYGDGTGACGPTCPHDVIIAQNTVDNVDNRSGIVISTPGGNITVVNNIVTHNHDYGILNEQCALGGCLVDHNLAWNNGLGAVSGPATNTLQADPLYIDSAFHLASNSAAVNAARSDYSYSPDRDGTPRPQSGAPDIGAYEQ